LGHCHLVAAEIKLPVNTINSPTCMLIAGRLNDRCAGKRRGQPFPQITVCGFPP
jgi:hypothetical protein